MVTVICSHIFNVLIIQFFYHYMYLFCILLQLTVPKFKNKLFYHFDNCSIIEKIGDLQILSIEITFRH